MERSGGLASPASTKRPERSTAIARAASRPAASPSSACTGRPSSIHRRAFPAPAVVDEMRQLGVTHVMLHLDGLAPAQVSEAAASPAFELLAEAADLRLYRLRR